MKYKNINIDNIVWQILLDYESIYDEDDSEECKYYFPHLLSLKEVEAMDEFFSNL